MELVAKKYKQTDVGVIPIDWDVKRLLDVSDFSNGKAHEQSIDEAGDFVVVNSKFISTEGEIFKNSNQAISPLAKGDITLVMSDIPNGKALAKCYLIEIDNKYTLNQRICSIKTRVCDNVFLFYVLNRNKYFLSFDSGSGQTNLRRNEVLDCPLAIPPNIAEQTAIATALSDIDELISQTEKLIDKKKATKQGVMQELLKPKDGWVTKKLWKIVSIIKSGGTPLTSRNDYYNGEIPFLSIGDMTSQGKYLNSTASTISNQGLENSSSWLVPKNSLIYSMYASVGFVSINKIDLAISQAVLGMKFKENVSIDFMYYTLLSMQKSVLMFVGEGTQKNLNARTVKGFDIYLPDIKEQVRVAEILTDIDRDIFIIETKLQKLKFQKQGMMQALLTGKIRLL